MSCDQAFPELTAAIENAYRAFARYRLKGAICVCHCPVCVDAATERRLCTVPLREISSALLAQYTHSAHGFDSRVADEFRYFLPRYFELIACDDPPTNAGVETCLHRLHEASFRNNWPSSEVEAVDRFFLALFRARLAMPVEIDPSGMPGIGGDAVERVLCLAAHSDGDVPALLAAWEGNCRRGASLHIAAIVSIADWRKKRLENSWWTGEQQPHVEEAMHRVITWLLRSPTRERLETDGLTEREVAAAVLLSHAEGLVGGTI